MVAGGVILLTKSLNLCLVTMEARTSIRRVFKVVADLYLATLVESNWSFIWGGGGGGGKYVKF